MLWILALFIWLLIGVILITQSLGVLLYHYGVGSGVTLLWAVLTAWIVAFKLVAPLDERLRRVRNMMREESTERRMLIRKMLLGGRGWSILFVLSIMPYFIYFCLTIILLSMLRIVSEHKFALLWLSASFNISQVVRLFESWYTEFRNILVSSQSCDDSTSECKLCRIFPTSPRDS